MKKIKLSKSQFALVDDEDYDELIKYKWCASYCNNTKSFYAMRTGRVSDLDACGATIRMHRVIMNAPKGMQVDHIDHNTLDNQKINLRICTASQNAMNKGPSKSNKSGYKGVGWDKKYNKWEAQIMINGKHKRLGSFTCKHEAARVYNLASLKYHGEFAYINEIKEGK